MRQNSVKAALKAGKPQVGTWMSLGSPIASRFLARAGFDWLTLDMEHTPVDWSTAGQIFGNIADAGGVPLVRIPFNSLENAKRVLDAGAYGIVFPMCNSLAEAEQAVSVCKYPPHGVRSIGGQLHTLNFDTSAPDYYKNANEEILVVIQAEHIKAVENCEEMFRVPGVDAMFVGPNDLLSSMHKTPNMDSDDPEFLDAIEHLRKTAIAAGIAPGIHVASPEAALRRIEQGWRFIAIASEMAMMLEAARNIARKATGTDSTSSGPRY